MKRLFSVTVRRSDGTNQVENVVTPGTDTKTNEKRAAEDAVQTAYPGSEVEGSNYQCDIHREVS